MTAKQQIQALLDLLPSEATFEEIQNHLNTYGGRRSVVETLPSTEVGPGGRARHQSGADAFRTWQDIVSI